jgi:choice-of-anchor A domain-containing protein
MNTKSANLVLVSCATILVLLGMRSNCSALPVDLGAASAQYSFASASDRPQSMLDYARHDAIAASAAAARLSPTSSLNQINLRRKNLTLDAGVYNLTNLQLKRSTLTLSGSGTFIFNISSAFALNSARVLLAGGATEANVLFNYTGTSAITLSGRRGGSVLHGIILALNAKVNLAPGLVVGEIINGSDSSATIIQNLAPSAVSVPEGASSTFLLSLIALGALGAFQSFLVHRANR